MDFRKSVVCIHEYMDMDFQGQFRSGLSTGPNVWCMTFEIHVTIHT